MQRNNLNYFFVLLFPLVLVLPLPLIVSSISLGLALVNILLVDFLNSKSSFRNLINLITNLLFFLGCFVFMLDTFTTILREFEFEFYFRESRISFVAIPLVFSLMGKRITNIKRDILISFISGIILYIVYAYGYLIYFYNIVTNRSFELNHYLKYDLREYLPFAYHHTYFGIYLSFGILIIFYGAYLQKHIRPLYAWVLALFMFSNQVFMGSKFSLYLSIGIAIFFILLELKDLLRSQKIVFIIMSSILVVLFTALIWQQGLLMSIDNSVSFRFDAWQCSVKGIWNNLPFGMGRDQAVAYLSDCMIVNAQGTHNQFFEEALYYGIFSIWYFVFFLIIWKKGKGDLLFQSFIVLIFLVSQFENILSLQRGILFALFFTSLFYYSSSNKGPKEDVLRLTFKYGQQKK